MDTWHSILSRWIKPWTKVSLLSRIPPKGLRLYFTFSMIPDPRLLIASSLSSGRGGVKLITSDWSNARGIVNRTCSIQAKRMTSATS